MSLWRAWRSEVSAIQIPVADGPFSLLFRCKNSEIDPCNARVDRASRSTLLRNRNSLLNCEKFPVSREFGRMPRGAGLRAASSADLLDEQKASAIRRLCLEPGCAARPIECGRAAQ